MNEERYKQIKDSIELQSLVKKQMGVEDELLQEEIELLKAYGKLKDNWKNLKQIIKKKFVAQGGFTSYEWNDLLNDLLNKMQELEQGSDSNVKN